MKTFIEELDGLQTVLDYQKRALNLIMDSWRKSAETKELDPRYKELKNDRGYEQI